MVTIKKGRAGLGLVMGTVLGAGLLAEEVDFVARLNEAREAVFSGAGKEFYDGAFSKAFYAQYPGRLTECMKRTGDTEQPGFDMLLKLAGNGSVEAAMVKPESKITTCYLELVKKDVFPKPPSAGFWVPVSIRFSKP